MPKDNRLKDRLKRLANRLPFPLTRNQYIDHLCGRIIRRHCKRDSNCVDVGCHKGEMLDVMLRAAPEGTHFAFEPLPDLFHALSKRYGNRVRLFPWALSNQNGSSNFNYVYTNPAYSGFVKRRYDRQEADRMISVETVRLDRVVPEDVKIDLIKIDVEGAELWVMEGAERILKESRPLLLFEHGKGGADRYGYGPEEMFDFLNERGYRLYGLGSFLKKEEHLSQSAFIGAFQRGVEFYFVANPMRR